MKLDSEKILFVGVGGMGMAPLACWMSEAGYAISGYDGHLQERVRGWLAQAGVTLHDFVFPEQMGNYTTLVHSSAVPQRHPLLVAAREAGLRTLRRGEMLAAVAREKRLIAVAGSHGKTTTSGMIAHGIAREQNDCHYILGGLFADQQTPPWKYSAGDWMVAEIDESDGTIEAFEPEVTLLLNVDWDHTDHYAAPSNLETTFQGLLDRTKATVIVSAEGKLKPSGAKPTCVAFDGAANRYGLRPPPPGRFNQLNGDAAAAVLGLFRETLSPSLLENFPGMARRQTKLLEQPGLTVVEDYAHHPTEIDALIECLRAREPEKRLIVVFQPHRYSRTRQFKSEFARSLSAADAVYLLPVYAAFESASGNGGVSELADEFVQTTPIVLPMNLTGIESLAARCGDYRKGELTGRESYQIAFVGAGDIEEFAAAFVAHIQDNAPTVDSLAKCSLGRALEGYLAKRLSKGCALKIDEPLAQKTTIRIGGPARFYAEPENLSDLRVLLRAAQLFGLEVFCLGRGSNLLISDTGFNGIVVRFSAPAWRRVVRLGEGLIWAAAGTRLKEICGFAANEGLSGFEFLEGIPGSVGGALRMNAGAMGSWMFDLVERVQMLDGAGAFHDLPKEAFHFGYRKVEEISRGIALGAVLRSADREMEADIRGRIDSYSTARKESQPRGASAGCIFKNPEGNYAGKLIDELGIKGMRVGAAEVSAVHGNFILNGGGASAADVIELVRRIRRKVKAESGYILEPEVLLVGQSWSEVLAE